MLIREDKEYPSGLDVPTLLVEGLREAKDAQTAMNNLDLIWRTARKRYPNATADDLFEMVRSVFEKSLNI